MRVRRLRLPLRVRAALAVGALAAAAVGVGASGAAFTDTWSTDWQITTGSVALAVDGDGLVFDSAPMAPGASATATATLHVRGSLPATVTLTRTELLSTAPGGCALRDALRISILKDRDGDPATHGDRGTILDAALADVPARLDLGTLQPGDVRSYTVTLTFAARHGATATDNDNCFQGAVAHERFDWDAAQAAEAGR
jgi:hypothetical protein